MSVIGLCHRCNKPAILTCPVCGRVVCRSCYDGAHGVCLVCKENSRTGFERRF